MSADHESPIKTPKQLITVVVLAFVVRSLPYGVRSGIAALDQVHRSLDASIGSVETPTKPERAERRQGDQQQHRTQ